MSPSVRSWTCGQLDAGLERQVERVSAQADVCRVAVMPDVHQGRSIPNGIAVATRELIYPDLVGSDIGCGIAAVRFLTAAADLDREFLESLLDRLLPVVPTLKQTTVRAAAKRPMVAKLGPLSSQHLDRVADRAGTYQLGTLGRGNHFLELASADDGSLWAVVHSGSRAMGQEITNHYLRIIADRSEPAAPAGATTAAPLPSLALGTSAGQAYLADMQWACRYATANRLAMLNAVADLLEDGRGIEVDAESFVDSPHNMARIEEHDGEQLIVHRKSVNRAAAGQAAIVAGSMAIGSRITVGLGLPEALASSAHGAGRVMSRSEAGEKILTRDLQSRMRRIVYRRQWSARFRDEAPQAYRELHEVMQAQRQLVRTAVVLSPILNDKRP